MFNDSQKKHYSEMPETELNVDENYLEIFQDELNNILGNNLKKNVFLDKSNDIIDSNNLDKKIIKNKLVNNTKPDNIINKTKPDNIINKTKPDNIINKTKPDNIINKTKPDNIINEVENKYVKKMINKSSNNIIDDNLKYTKKLFNKIRKENTSKSSKSTIEIKKYENESDIKNDIDDKIILDSKDILAIKMLINYLNNKLS
jgi:hypothetical protein